MPDPLEDKALEFLFKEYDTANEVTFHVDTFRDKLSAFFLSFAGAAVAVVLLILKGEWKGPGNHNIISGSFLIGVGVLGTVILLIHARLRKVQLENFAIICRIRAYFFQKRLQLWNVVQLTPNTLPKIGFWKFKGSELWATSVIIPVAALLTGGIALILGEAGLPHSKAYLRWETGAMVFLIICFGLWCWYARLATYNYEWKAQVTSDDIDKWLGDYGLSPIAEGPMGACTKPTDPAAPR